MMKDPHNHRWKLLTHDAIRFFATPKEGVSVQAVQKAKGIQGTVFECMRCPKLILDPDDLNRPTMVLVSAKVRQ